MYQKGKMMAHITYNKNSLLKNGKPWFPIMGEFHFSRCPSACWKDEIRKMKAGGVNILSTYVIWIHHEELEGDFDFTGRRSLRDFLNVCRECEMPVFLRPGPWVHAEVRNGGFPDWLMKKGWGLRTDDPRYLEKVRLFWEQVYCQAEDFMDNIIGIQIENEYGHVGGLRGEAGNQHMRTLTALAKRIGFETDCWTATGWGGAVIGDLLPVMGGYCDAPWMPADQALPPNRNYRFTRTRNDGNLISDTHPEFALSFPKEDYPYLTAELGGGLQVTHHRRPFLHSGDIAAMALAKLGSGCSLLGFYMYHGGTNPRGKRSALQESLSSGGFSDLPVFSYDFQAPIREFGQMTDTVKELKLLAMFAEAFGGDLCEMDPVFDSADTSVSGFSRGSQTDSVIYGESPDDGDLSHIRAIVRRKEDRGYVFLSNYQRLCPMKPHRQVSLCLKTRNLQITWPARDIDSQTFFFYPFHFPLGETRLNWINRTPLTRLGTHVWVFFGNDPLRLETEHPLRRDTILSLTREAAKNCWQIPCLPEGMFFSSAPVVETDAGAEILLRSDISRSGQFLPVDLVLTAEALPAFAQRASFREYSILRHEPEPVLPDYARTAGNPDNLFFFHRLIPVPVCRVECRRTLLHGEDHSLVCELEIHYDRTYHFPEEEIFLDISFAGDAAELYQDDQLIADQFYIGESWETGLGRYGFPEKLTLKILPLHETDNIHLDRRPDFTDGICCRLDRIRTVWQTKQEVI